LPGKKEDLEAEELYKESFDKYKKAIAITPDNHEAFNNWGSALIQLAKRKEGEEAEKLYDEAVEKAKKSVELGGHSYNLACAYALKQNKEKALFYLNKSLEKGEITADFVKKDEDWKSYLNAQEFIEILNKHTK
jgi:tetratricopeptide (TPR) repeat protein